MENNEPNQRQQNNGQKPPSRFNRFVPFIYTALFLGLFYFLFFQDNAPESVDIYYSTLERGLRSGCVKAVDIDVADNVVYAEIDNKCGEQIFDKKFAESDKLPLAKTLIPSSEEFSKLLSELQKEQLYTGTVNYKEGFSYLQLISPLISILFMVMLFVFMFRGMGSRFNVGKARVQMGGADKKQKITFKDVAGLAGAKQEVEEIVSFLKNPKKYTNLGGKIPKGALLVGPPGTGKTLLAKAVAGEANVPFFSMSGSDFVEMFVGVGASRVRDLFRQAKAKAPCIIFIDEIDAVGRARSMNLRTGGNDERESTLNQLLTEMDGFGTNSGVIILAATNRADILDKALLRAGRFDRQINIELPDLHERKEIFDVHLRPLKLDQSLDIDFLARQTPGFSGADIANVCNEAALIAARHDKESVGKQDFLDAVDRIVGGLEKKTKILTIEEKRNIAFHEAGHATISWMLRWGNPLVKVTIVPRGQALGAAWYLPEERQLTSDEHMLDDICSLLGGRAAEELCFGTLDTGALNDLERATKKAYAMVAYFGMSSKLPNISYYDTQNQEFALTKPYSEKTAELIDSEAKKIIAEQYERAKKILTDNKEGHAQLARILIDREVLFAEDVEKILGKRQWASRADELLLANGNAENKVEETENDK